MLDKRHDILEGAAHEAEGYALWETVVSQHKDQMDTDSMLELFFNQFVDRVDFDGVMDVLAQNPQFYMYDVGLFDAMLGYFKTHRENLPKDVDVKQYLAKKISSIVPEDEMPEYLEPMLAMRVGDAPDENAFLEHQKQSGFEAEEYMGEAEPQPVEPIDDYVPSNHA